MKMLVQDILITYSMLRLSRLKDDCCKGEDVQTVVKGRTSGCIFWAYYFEIEPISWLWNHCGCKLFSRSLIFCIFDYQKYSLKAQVQSGGLPGLLGVKCRHHCSPILEKMCRKSFRSAAVTKLLQNDDVVVNLWHTLAKGDVCRMSR
jgi:hypothetical protein